MGEAKQINKDGADAGGLGFTHLHLHTEYSLLDGGNQVERLVARIAELGMKAVAVTDHGNLFGAAAVYAACKEKGIKPILGVEAYVTPPGKPRTDRTYSGGGEGGYHLVLLAENNVGWQNLLVLCSEAYLTGFYYKPRIDRELLEKHSEGLIAINGHLGSEIGEHLLDFHRSGERKFWDAAEECALWCARVFNRSEEAKERGSEEGKENANRASTASAEGGSSLPRSLAPSLPRFFIELQHHVPEQNSINPLLIKLARELNLPLVCDNDAHFLRAEDHDAHDTLICISTGKGKNDQGRMRYPRDVYVKSAAEMEELFEQYGDAGREALDNVAKIAERCNVELPMGVNNAPLVRVDVPEAGTLPKWDDPKYGGDLTAWYKDYCSRFEVRPFKQHPTDDEKATAKTECDRALRMLAEAGMVWRYGPLGGVANPTPTLPPRGREQETRLERELKILADKAISAYFLIVWDFVNWGRQRGIPSVARGSGVGTMVGYVLGLSNACPVKYGLLFERFTDPDRSEFPDIDIDLCQDGRGEVINYVRQKYGHVAQIITFGTLKARAAIRDVGRVLEMPLPEVDKIAKLIPETLGIELADALKQEPELQKLYDNDDRVRQLLDNAIALEGHTRHAGIHAAGVIVATRPLHEIVPLYRPAGNETQDIITQWDGPTCEKMGLLKMDFLGLRTLSIVERAKKLIRETLGDEEIWKAVGRGAEHDEVKRWADADPKKRGAAPLHISHPMDLDRLSYADQKVFELFRRGETTGVFQFESGGMRRLLVEMKPDRLEDLIAANALFRPGPMDLIPDYNRRKHGQQEVPKVHEIVDRFTSETYGVMVYQEQVMQIVHGLGGIKLRDAYTLIKNISKKKYDKIEKEKPKFVEGSQKQGLTKQAAEELFDLILKFAGYGFNKSHSTGYAIVAYQTAYLKTYFPNQYMAAFLTFESQANKVSDWIPYLEDCRRTRFVDAASGKQVKVGVEVRPPDVNLSNADFAVVFDPNEPHDSLHGHVRFGLKAIKGVGDKAIDAMITDRNTSGPFASIFDFCERIPSQVVPKATIESLIKCGAFDSVHNRAARASMLATVEQAQSAGGKIAQDKAVGQGGLFFGEQAPAPKVNGQVPLVKAEAWTEAESMSAEKEVLGFYVSSHPLDRWKAWSGAFANVTTAGIKEQKQDSRVVLAAMVQSLRTIVTRNGKSAGQKMAIVTLEDVTGSVDAVMFAEVYGKFGHLAVSEGVVFALGRVDLARGEPQIIVDRLVPIDCVPLDSGKVRMFVDERRLNGACSAAISRIAELVHTKATEPAPARGEAPTKFHCEVCIGTDEQWAVIAADPRLKISLEPGLVKAIIGELGEGMVQVVGGATVERESGRNGKPWKRREED